MPYYYEMTAPSAHARIVARGVTSASGFSAVVDRLMGDPRFTPMVPVLLDARDASNLPEATDLRAVAAVWQRVAHDHPVGILVASGVAFGVARQLAAIVPELHVFVEGSEARRWLAAVDPNAAVVRHLEGMPPASAAAAGGVAGAPNAAPAAPRAIHVSGTPEETYLLALQLEADGLELAVVPAATRVALEDAMESAITMVIADLPLPWPEAADDLSEMQRTRPDVPIVFRWGGAGTWNVEEGGAQLGRLVRQALALAPESAQTTEQRRAVLQEVVRYQTAHLQLGRLDPWESEGALRQALEIVADTAGVERVGVWRLAVDRDVLECEALFVRSTRTHGHGDVLHLDPAYRRAIEESTFVAAHDAIRDPRTSAFAEAYLQPHGITSMLDAPIRSRGRVVGIVCLEHVGAMRRWNVVEQCAAAAFAGVVGRFIDTRERRRIDEEWQESKRLDLIGRMAAAISHDFSNLATVIVSCASELLDDLPAADRRREPLMAISEAGLSAARLVKQLRAYTRAQPGEAQPLDVRRALRTLQPLVQRLLGPTIQLVIEVGGDDVWVQMDPAQFQAVVLNLTANARDALPRGGTFSLQLDVLASGLASPAESGLVRLRAADNGCGIAEDRLPDIFKPLYTTKGDLGTGLGLSNVRAMVAQAGGDVSVQSTPDVGTCFSVVLPRIEAPVPHAAPVSAGEPSAPAPAPAGTVLIVDDDPAVCGLMARLVRRLGWAVESATSPKAAIDIAQRLGSTLGLVVTDFTMRGMSGIELVHVLRGHRPDLPALLVTGHAEVESIADGTASSRIDVLAKPFDAQAFVSRVRALVGRAGGDTRTSAPAERVRSVLLFEESDQLRELVSLVLTNAHYRVITAESHAHLCALAAETPEPCAVVVSADDGARLASTMKALGTLNSGRRIVVSGEANHVTVGEEVTVLRRPYSPAELLDALAVALDARALETR